MAFVLGSPLVFFVLIPSLLIDRLVGSKFEPRSLDQPLPVYYSEAHLSSWTDWSPTDRDRLGNCAIFCTFLGLACRNKIGKIFPHYVVTDPHKFRQFVAHLPPYFQAEHSGIFSGLGIPPGSLIPVLKPAFAAGNLWNYFQMYV